MSSVLPRFLLIRKILSDIKLPIFAILMLFAIGTYALHRVESWTYEQALYYLITTFSTVGFGDITPSTIAGRRWTMAIIVFGIGIITLSINSIGNRIIQNTLNHDFRYEEAIKTFEAHIVIAGYSDVGKRIATYLRSWKVKLVVVDTDFDLIKEARSDGHAAIQGDISNPKELQKLNLQYARGIILAIQDPNVTLISAQAARVLNPDMWIICEADIDASDAMYKRAGIVSAIDRFQATKTKIRGILWGLEIENLEYFMPDGIAFFQIPNFKLLTHQDLIDLDFKIVGLLQNDEFFPYKKNEQKFDASDYLLVMGPATKTKKLATALKTHLPKDKDGVKRVMIVGYGDYAKTIISTAIRNADEVVIIDHDEDARKQAKQDGGSKVDVRSRASNAQLKVTDIVLLTSRSAGNMLSLTLKARELNDDVKVYARAAVAEHIDIFEAAGAEYVFSPEVDCASLIAGKAIEFEFNTKSIPFKNGQLLFHEGDVRMRGVKSRKILASYVDKRGETEEFGRRRKGKNSYNLEFVQFKQ